MQGLHAEFLMSSIALKDLTAMAQDDENVHDVKCRLITTFWLMEEEVDWDCGASSVATKESATTAIQKVIADLEWKPWTTFKQPPLVHAPASISSSHVAGSSELEVYRTRRAYTESDPIRYPTRLEVRAEEILCLLSKSDSSEKPSEWWRCRALSGLVGHVHSTNLRLIYPAPLAGSEDSD